MDTNIEIRPGRRINITIQQHADNRPTIFLIHGLGGRGNQWRKQVHRLEQHYSLVIPDLLGHGKSDKPAPDSTNPYSFLEFDQDLHALFDKFATEENILIGHSYGGPLATSLALDHQDQITQLILISPTACSPSRQIPAFYRMPVFLMNWLLPWIENQFIQLAFCTPADPALVAEELEAGRANSLEILRAVVNGMESIPALDVTMLTIPTLVLIGVKDGIIDPVIQQQFYQALPHHRFELIDQCAHMLMLEKPEIVNTLVNNFLLESAMLTNT